MAEEPIVVVAHFVATSKATRGELLHHLHLIAEHAREHETGTSRLAICLPDSSIPNPDNTSIFVFEEYADQNAFDNLNNSSPVLALQAKHDSSDGPLWDLSKTKVRKLTWLKDAMLERTDRLPSTKHPHSPNRVQAPYIFWATIDTKTGGDVDVLKPYGAAVVEDASENEPDTIFYADAVEAAPVKSCGEKTSGCICTLEVYATKEAAAAHLQRDSVKMLQAEGQRLGSTFTLTGLDVVEGWLTRE